MFINSINPIKEQQMTKISEYSKSLKNESNKEKYNLELVKLNPSCEI